MHQKKRYSSGLRLWHWLSAIAIAGSLLTVLINSTVLSGSTSVSTIKSSLASNHVTISDDQARSVAHDLRDNVWSWHTWIGFALVALLLFRLIVEITQPSGQKLIKRIINAWQRYDMIRQDSISPKHEFWVKTSYALFYILLFITAMTGLDLAFEDDFKYLRKFHFLKEVHAFNMYLILLFIIVHLGGVFLAERRKTDKGIVSDMINGGENSELLQN
jgi:cytochrome b561